MKVQFRVKTNQDFQKIIHDNKKISNSSFVLYFSKNNYEHARVGISTSKKIGNAVVRSTTRRQVRMMAKDVFNFSKSKDYIIIVRKNYLEKTYQENYELLSKLVNKIKED
jgi:ribonuclease P protein component